MAKNLRLRRERRLEAARGYLALEMPDHALEQLTSIEDPENSPFAVNTLKGEALRQNHEYEAALRVFGRALAEQPADTSVLLAMAWCYKRLDQLPRAIAATEQAYRQNPDEPITLYNLSCYYALAGAKGKALSWLGRALRMQKSLRDLIAHESDFDQLRDDPDFRFVTSAADLTGER